MKIVVIGGSGLVGTKVVKKLTEVDPVPCTARPDRSAHEDAFCQGCGHPSAAMPSSGLSDARRRPHTPRYSLGGPAAVSAHACINGHDRSS